ncbi:MAG: HD-GYP domain-containing protein [Sedimentisphaerales bacterium]|nr:HD-GYP domain-containing protein [Sedimentisphaerales bacterium]
MGRTTEITLTTMETDRLRKFLRRLNELGVPSAVLNGNGRCLIDPPLGMLETPGDVLASLAGRVCSDHPGTISRFENLLALGLGNQEQSHAVLVAEVGSSENPNCPENYVREILALFAENYTEVLKTTAQIEKFSSELALTYEELMLVYNMSTHMKVTQSNANYLQMAVDQVTQLVDVEGIAIFLEKKIDGIERFVLTAGAGLVAIDQVTVDLLQQNLLAELRQGKEALLDSEVDPPFTYEWPKSIRNIIAVPMQGNERMIGMMVATNILNKPDFDSIDVKLFNCVANQCTVFIENGRLFGDLKELFIGSLKALTNSIDAKDRYTRGHSERVAFISRWIAERLAETMPIREDQIHHIYLAGLLHDIGKIGVGEAVLCKKGALTEEERNRIKAHPRIGASILADIKQMKDIVPGVLYHHERVDGKGYPEGLTGDQIPMIGKILSLADSFDAMTSKRVYRDAMSIKRALTEIEKGLGTQFDEQIGRIFLESDVRKLWSIIQDGFIESWDYSNFSEYGAVAVGTLIR